MPGAWSGQYFRGAPSEEDMNRKESEIYTGIDIGTHSIKVLTGEFLDDGSLRVLGQGESPSLKMCKGEITDARFVLEQLRRTMSQAEEASGLDISRHPVFLALSGRHLRIQNNIGRVDVRGSGGRVSEDDMVAAANLANSIAIPDDQVPLHSYMRFHRLDDGRELLNAIGQGSSSLEVELQYVLGNRQRINTVCGVVADALGTRAAAAIYTPLVIGCASLRGEDLSDGRLSIDLGAGTTSYSVLTSLGCLQCGQYTIGCEQIANDLSIAFQITIEAGRKLVRELGTLGCSAWPQGGGQGRQVCLDRTRKGRAIPADGIEQVVALRLRELFELLRQDLAASRAWHWVKGEVLLSGGGARIPGVVEIAREVLQHPVSLARPYQASGPAAVVTAPGFMTAIGLLRCGQRDLRVQHERDLEPSRLGDSLKLVKQFFRVLVNW